MSGFPFADQMRKAIPGSLGKVAEGMKKFTAKFKAPEISDDLLINDEETAREVQEIAQHKGFKFLLEFQKNEISEIEEKLKYNRAIDKEERLFLQGRLDGLEGWQKAFNKVIAAGANAKRMLDERKQEKEKHGR